MQPKSYSLYTRQPYHHLCTIPADIVVCLDPPDDRTPVAPSHTSSDNLTSHPLKVLHESLRCDQISLGQSPKSPIEIQPQSNGLRP